MGTKISSKNVVERVQELLRTAFSGGVFLPPSNQHITFADGYATIFDTPGKAFSSSFADSWVAQFRAIILIVYEDTSGIATKVVGDITECLIGKPESNPPVAGRTFDEDGWRGTRDSVIALQQTLTVTKYDLDGDREQLQNNVLDLYDQASRLKTMAEGRNNELKKAIKIASEDIAKMKASIDILAKSWVIFAKNISLDEEQGRKLSTSTDWFPYLDKWADFGDMCDRSSVLLEESVLRLKTLQEQLEGHLLAFRLPTLINACFNLYGNLLANNTHDAWSDIADLRDQSGDLLAWLDKDLPWTDNATIYQNKIKHGQQGFRELYVPPRQNFGDDPETIHLEPPADPLLGISRLDFERYRPTALRLRKENPSTASRYWENIADSIGYETRLAWMHVPGMANDSVQFGNSLFSKPGPSFVVDNDILLSRTIADPISWVGPSGRQVGVKSSWDIKFRKPFASDNITVRVWMKDQIVHAPSTGSWGSGAQLEVSNITRDSFQVTMYVSIGCDCIQMNVSYIAYEGGPPNFHTLEYHKKPLITQGEQNHNWPATYFAFPPGKFKRRPAVEAFLSSWNVEPNTNPRLDVRWSVTRDGVVVQATPWADTVLYTITYILFAVSND